MEDDVINVENLVKVYRRVRRNYLFFKVDEDVVQALQGVSFSAKRGEIVALLGPNGSGKSTLIKILSGILHPDGGSVSVLGYVPWERSHDYLRRIGVVFGQRSALIWDVPVKDTYELHQGIYSIPMDVYEETLEFLDRYLGIIDFFKVQARKLSLGQRMRCEVGLALLHRPDVLLLDEPTIGIDVWTREKIKTMLQRASDEWGTTILYATHQMGDIEGLANRVLLMSGGSIAFNGSLRELRHKVPYKYLSVEFVDRIPDLGYEIVERIGNYVRYRVPRESARSAVENVLRHEVVDLSLEEPDLETVLKEVLRNGA